ncbi:MAG: MBL fold metallo-hydrolase [Pseudomonadales bacterium]|nr:MBL fold metallo-hydrolase [Pseudomonadales bacterium]MCP5184274.1 MBL fold metallo-hydrolase [Pseudomonadales bacterium]
MSLSDYEKDLILEQIEIGPMQNFAYIIGSRETRDVAVIDPAWDIDALVNHIDERGYNLTAALITHYHPDHCGGAFQRNNIEGVAELIGRKGVKVYAHCEECEGLKKVTGISDSDIVKVRSGDKLDVGNVEVEFLHTPGHTPGSQCFRIKRTLVSGDTLFITGCGRVDLPGSNSEQMYHSLHKLAELPDDTLLLPGHNYSHVPHLTMGETKRINTYMRVKDLDTWRMFMGD